MTAPLLEELPANMTKQLLAQLTPEERAIAVSLLGYPERSIGRLMTPDYIAVRQKWSIQYTSITSGIMGRIVKHYYGVCGE